MHIYIEGGKENEANLKEISNALYGRRYHWLGGDRFYFGYTVITTNVERPYCQVTFENEHSQKQMAFIETLARQFSILRVEAEDQEEEGDTVAAWAQAHQQQPLPKKIESTPEIKPTASSAKSEEKITPPTGQKPISLLQAIKKTDSKLVLEALKNEPDADVTHALRYAMAFSTSVETAKILIEHGAKVKDQDVLPELAAYGRGGAAMAKLLLEAGADVDERSSGGYTPLIIAAGRGYTGIVRVLLEAGADVNAVGASNRTAKSLAYERGYSETAHLIEEWESKKTADQSTSKKKPTAAPAKKWWEFWK